MSELIRIIATYVPPNLVQNILEEPLLPNSNDPIISYRKGALLLISVSDFISLTEIFTNDAEELVALLNKYFSRLIDLAEAEGGEVVKFSSDSMMIFFAVGKETLGQLGHAIRRAEQAAESIQKAVNEFNKLPIQTTSISLIIKMGIGAGEITEILVGGIFDRWEYVAMGAPVQQAFKAKDQAQPGEIKLSAEAHTNIYPHDLSPQPLPKPNWSKIDQLDDVKNALQCYIPAAVTAWLEEKKASF